MRAEIIRCDTCAKEHDAIYKLPVAWIETRQRDTFDNEEEHHCCSKACLISWASNGQNTKKYSDHLEECLTNIGISLELLDPKSVTMGTAAIFAQMQILETVKDDYAKLKDAILTTRRVENDKG
jgi:hypothetical protein